MPLAPSPDNSIIPFENLAQNLPEAFSALEGQFEDPAFKAMLTSQLNNPNAVEMFQSLIHDSSAANSISALLDDPSIQSSLSVQFVEQYLSPTDTAASTNSGADAEATNDVSSEKGKHEFENSLKNALHSTDSGATGKPRALVVGFLLTIILGALAPV
ncbi:hypothetical protein H4R20_005754 [Coemansia guatemalensis]|uniref:Uncharacterized protein n=1 Tax=Coemansia guatemalensis TaxID=2761395 RepID=A0A9W8LQH5_9FUNG|nr:hypothetical protein H4R20_005754 [Coemansia guatemalensis]